MSRILIADDDAVIRLTCQHILQNAGHDVVLAENGEEAWQILQREVVSLLLSDIAMPKMDGYTLLRRVRQHPTMIALPVIMLTSLGDDESTLASMAAEANVLLTKPVSSWELVESVSRLTEDA